MSLRKLLPALLLVPAVLASPVPDTDVETTSPAWTPNDIFRRDQDYYTPRFNRLCRDQQFEQASKLHRECVGLHEFQFQCIGGGKPETIVQGTCGEKWMCLETTFPDSAGVTVSVAVPDYPGLTNVVCTKWTNREEVDIEEDVTSKLTPLSAVPPLRKGHMYGTLELEGYIPGTHPVLEWEHVSETQSGALGQKKIKNDENGGLYRVYNIEANYEDSAKFAGLVKGLKKGHGQISLTMLVGYFPEPILPHKVRKE